MLKMLKQLRTDKTRKTMKKEDMKNLEWYDGGDGVTYEFWRDPWSRKIYRVEIEIVRDWDSAEEVDRVTH